MRKVADRNMLGMVVEREKYKEAFRLSWLRENGWTSRWSSMQPYAAPSWEEKIE